MVKHYLKIAFRNLARQKWLTAINIAGLSIGLACFTLFMLYAVNEFNFDRFHANKENIYRVYRLSESTQEAKVNQSVPLGPAMKQDIPDVENYVRIQEAQNETYVKVNNTVTHVRLSFADQQIFSVFSFKLVAGDRKTALKGLHDIVLTRKTAKKIFGHVDVIGEIIQAKVEDEFIPFTVSSIVEDIPSNSTIQIEALGSYDFLATTKNGKRLVDNWRRQSVCLTYVQLKPGSTLASDFKTLTALRKKYYPDEEAELRKLGYWTGKGAPVRYGLQPLTSLHTDTKIVGGVVPVSDPKNIWIMLGIAFGVLLIACINFTTLAIGRSARRAKEIGIRKVVGSLRRQLVGQFIAEAFLLTILSVVLGLGLCYLLLPYFNSLSGKELHFSFAQFPEMYWLLAGLTLIVGLLAGSYPALVLSDFRPLEVLKQKIKIGGANFFARSLVTLQFVLSIGLIASTLIIADQLKYMTGKNPGFSKENVVMINATEVDGKKIYPIFKQAVISEPSIAGITSSDLGIGEGEGFTRGSMDYNGKNMDVFEYFVDHNFIPLMGMQLLRGRNFDPTISSDTINSVIVNEAMVRDFGWTLDNAIGQQLKEYSEQMIPVVIGVVKDFNFRPLSIKVEPQMFHQFSNYAPHRYFVRLKAGDPAKALAIMQRTWNALVTDIPFNYVFLDENIENFYKSEVRWSRIIGWAGGISIFLACLGLLGLAALAAVNRTKEIGVRKVLGASVPDIIGLLSKDFLKLVAIAIVIASPLAWYFMSKWLQDFAYRVNIGWLVFFIAGLSAVALALMTISLQAIRAAMANPVKSLRNE
jgi:putative ABC transport system permease protein